MINFRFVKKYKKFITYENYKEFLNDDDYMKLFIEEYEYLKSIWIKFESNKFIPAVKEEQIYHDYKSCKNMVDYC